MIVQFFNHGTGSSRSAITYLLQENDSEGKKREPQPEIFSGDPKLTGFLIDNNPRKFKYSSGVIAFRDGEKPTDRELKQIVKSFRESFCPDLGEDKVNMLIVRHQDKGNTELHILIPMVEMTTQKQFNINPPGPKAQQMCKDFSAVWNHKLGYAQVVEDPLKVAMSQFDAKTKEGSKNKKIKSRFGEEIAKLIRNGKIKSRDELCGFLANRGFTITRKGRDYLSVKLPNAGKSIRLRGPLFQKYANYPELAKQADNVVNKTFLNDFQAFNIEERLNASTGYRREFNNKAYVLKKRTHKGSTLHSSKTKQQPKVQHETTIGIGNHAIESNSNNILIGGSAKDLQAKQIRTAKGNGSQNATTSPSVGGKSSGATASIKKSLASVQSAIVSAMADYTNARTPEERESASRKLAELKAQEEKLQFELFEAEKAELNQEHSPASTPRRRPKP